mmetsp:Transcript_14578/g.36436  ORF Transcript_14578/g.36436 Transcript_14578/m.36436 type:complete len:244 (+) Transcript_14578:277-1008(+)
MRTKQTAEQGHAIAIACFSLHPTTNRQTVCLTRTVTAMKTTMATQGAVRAFAQAVCGCVLMIDLSLMHTKRRDATHGNKQPFTTWANMMTVMVGRRNSEGINANRMIVVMKASRPIVCQKSEEVLESRVHLESIRAHICDFRLTATTVDLARPQGWAGSASAGTLATVHSREAKAEFFRSPHMSSTATAQARGKSSLRRAPPQTTPARRPICPQAPSQRRGRPPHRATRSRMRAHPHACRREE